MTFRRMREKSAEVLACLMCKHFWPVDVPADAKELASNVRINGRCPRCASSQIIMAESLI